MVCEVFKKVNVFLVGADISTARFPGTPIKARHAVSSCVLGGRRKNGSLAGRRQTRKAHGHRMWSFKKGELAMEDWMFKGNLVAGAGFEPAAFRL
jgi:hypothetical protein